jgi:hypothetical protein
MAQTVLQLGHCLVLVILSTSFRTLVLRRNKQPPFGLLGTGRIVTRLHPSQFFRVNIYHWRHCSRVCWL